jgi:hypothetical protein
MSEQVNQTTTMTTTAEFCINTKRIRWEENFEKVFIYAKEHGHLRLPRKHAEMRRLSHWLNTQKKRKTLTNFERDKLALLKEYGYEHDDNRAAKFEKVWTTFFNDMVEYKRVHGLSVVPKTDKAHQKLYGWIVQQRKMQKQGRLPVERKEKLIEFGFDFQRIKPYTKKKRYTEQQEKTWDEMYAKLCDFHKEHDHCKVTLNDESNHALAKWVSTQRIVFGKGLMDDSRKQRLDDLNFTRSLQGNPSTV